VARPDTLDVHLAAQAADNQATAQALGPRKGRSAPPPVIANYHDLLKAQALRVTAAQADGLTNAIHNLQSSKFLMRGSVRWDEPLDQALMTIACQNQDAATAGDWARSFITRQAEVMAHIHVREVEVVETTLIK